MATLRKDIFLACRTCPRLGWLKTNKKADIRESLHDQMLMEQGLEVHGRAYKLFSGALHPEGDFLKAVGLTQNWVKQKKPSIIIEAAFLSGAAATKTDILLPNGNALELTEVKSCTNFKKDKHLPDLSYTYSVITKTGLNVNKCTLWLLSKDYRLGMADNQLFAKIDLTSEVKAMAPQFDSEIASAIKTINAGKPPKPKLLYDCRDCEYFEECFGRSMKGTISKSLVSANLISKH